MNSEQTLQLLVLIRNLCRQKGTEFFEELDNVQHTLEIKLLGFRLALEEFELLVYDREFRDRDEDDVLPAEDTQEVVVKVNGKEIFHATAKINPDVVAILVVVPDLEPLEFKVRVAPDSQSLLNKLVEELLTYALSAHGE